MSKEAIEALEAARAHILDSYRIWQADDVSAVPPPLSGAGAAIAKIDAALSSSPGKDGGHEVEAYAWAYEGRDSLPGSEWWPRVSLTLVEECAANRKTVRNVRPLYTRHQPTRMTNSADEIWIEPNPPADPHRGQDWSETNSWGQQATKYVRADLSTQPASTALVEAARFLADRLEDFRQKIDDIDDEREFEGHIIPALARLRAALASQSTSREGER